MELEGPEVKRIKLEHSYAFEFELNLVGTTQIKEEDPLKLFPEDINVIKSENEDVVIKNEVLEDNANQNFEYFNLPSINEQFENHSESNSSSTLVANEGDICNDVTDCLESVDNCNIVSNTETQPTDPLTLVNNYEETVPKHIFLEFQKRYEKTIVDLASQNTNLVNQLKKLEKENSELNTGLLVSNKDSSHQASFKAKVLQIEVNKLKQELKAAKAKEKLLEMKVHMREHLADASLVPPKKECCRRKEALTSDPTDYCDSVKLVFVNNIDELKQFLIIKQVELARQITRFEQKMMSLDNDLFALTRKLSKGARRSKKYELRCVHLENKLEKTKTVMGVMEKSLADSITAREILTERTIKLTEELQRNQCVKRGVKVKLKEAQEDLLNTKQNLKSNEYLKVKLEETQEELLSTKQQVEVLQQSLHAQKQMSLHFSQERDELLEEHEFNEANNKLVNMKKRKRRRKKKGRQKKNNEVVQ